MARIPLNVDKTRMSKMAVTYVATFVAVLICLTVIPPTEGYCSQPLPINAASSLLFALLTVLTIRLLNISITPVNAMGVALFLSFFSTSAAQFFMRNEESLAQLASQCIVPFFITQYMRVSRKNFGRWYLLMLLMGIFCSYTHNGITIPLCAGFVWQGLLRRREFFHTACWPMVVGFVIGTSVSILQAVMNGTSDTPTDLHQSISQTTLALKTVWETKIFLISLGVTMYLTLSHRGRKLLLECVREQALLTSCVAFSLCTLPFAPLGLDNAMTGVCFFCMYWTLIICKTLFGKIYGPGAAAGGKEQNAVPWPLGHLAGKR